MTPNSDSITSEKPASRSQLWVFGQLGIFVFALLRVCKTGNLMVWPAILFLPFNELTNNCGSFILDTITIKNCVSTSMIIVKHIIHWCTVHSVRRLICCYFFLAAAFCVGLFSSVSFTVAMFSTWDLFTLIMDTT